MARSNVPKFGNWESEENISYTTYFENARRVSSSEKMNTKNSPDNRNLKQEARRRSEDARAKHEAMVSQEEGELRRTSYSPSHHFVGNRTCGDPTYRRFGGVSSDSYKTAARPNGGALRSADNSPLHPNYRAKFGTKGNGVSSPSWERKSSSEGSHGLAPSTPGRSRLKSVPRGSETPDRGASVPKFGEWDETDPSSADGFTHIFDRVKGERHGGVGNAPSTKIEARHSEGQRQYKGSDSKGCWCFPWTGN